MYSPCRHDVRLQKLVSAHALFHSVNTQASKPPFLSGPQPTSGQLTFNVCNLLWADSQVAKHARLLDHMAPLSRRAQPRQLLEQPSSHFQNPPAHRHQILRPLLLDLGRPQHRLADARAVQRRGANGRALRILQNALHGEAQLARGRDEEDGPGALAVETHGLGKGQAHGGL